MSMQDVNIEFEVPTPPEMDVSLEIVTNGTFWGNIQGDITEQTDLQNALNDKQDVLTAGDNIQIEDNVISATDTTYTAGEGISIEDNVISNTQTSAEWGNIEGDIADQTDLIDLIDTKIDIEATARENNDLLLQNGINTLNDDLTAEISNRGTADGILQGNIDTLSGTVTSNYNTLDGKIGDNKTAIDNHIADKTNPHEVTKSQVGLGNVDNTSDLNKPISTATQQALDGKVPTSRTVNSKALTSDINLTASDVDALPDTTTINDLTTAEQQSALNSGANTTNIGQIATNTQNISNEVTNRQNADNALQSQIDALVVASDVFDIVGTYAELQAYDISTVPVNDIIKVLVDSTHNNAATYYRCVENDNVKSWSYIGAEGAYYTKSEADGRFVEQTTTINGQALSNNVTLDAEDVGALPDSTTIGNGKLTIQRNNIYAGEFTANQTANSTVNITVPTKTSDITNDSFYLSMLQDWTQPVLTSNGTMGGDSFAVDSSNTVTDLWKAFDGDNSTFVTFSGEQSYDIIFYNPVELRVTEISFSYVSQPLGYFTSISGSNDGTTYTSIGYYQSFNNTIVIYETVDYKYYKIEFREETTISEISITAQAVKTLSDVAYSGSYTDLSDKPTIPAAQVNSDWNASSGVAQILNKPTIPSVGNGNLTITQGGTPKGTFSANSSQDVTIDLDAGGGSSTDVQINGTSITSGGVANIVTEGVYDATDNKIATMSDLDTKQDVLTAGQNITITSTPITPAVDTRDTATVTTVSSTTWQEVGYCNGKYIAIGNSGYIAIKEGDTWGTPFTVGSAKWKGITYGNGKYVICGIGGQIAYTTDLANWTRVTVGSTSSTYEWNDVIFVNNTFIAISAGKYIATSSDGENWTVSQSTVFRNKPFAIGYYNGVYIVSEEVGKVETSTDLLTWTTKTVGSNTWNAVAYAFGKYVIAGAGGYMSYSTDLSTWAIPFKVGTAEWQELVLGDGYLVAVGNSGNTSTTTDASIWTTPIAIGSSNWYGLACNGSNYVAVGVSGVTTNFEITNGQEGGTVINGAEIVSAVDSTSTNSQCVGAKLFYDTVGDIETLLSEV